MTWVKLDASFPVHPKILSLSDSLFRLHVSAICYAGSLRTDGFVSEPALKYLGGTELRARKLVAAGVWEDAPGGWQIHDFLVYNRSRSESEEADTRLRAQRSAAGKASARARRPSNETPTEDERNANGPVEVSLNGPVAVPLNKIRLDKSRSERDPTDLSSAREEKFRETFAQVESYCGPLNRIHAEELAEWLEAGLSPAWIIGALSAARSSGKSRWVYVRAIIDGYRQDGGPPTKVRDVPRAAGRNGATPAAWTWEDEFARKDGGTGPPGSIQPQQDAAWDAEWAKESAP